MNAARTLRHARRRAGLSQRELATRVGVPQPAVARIESGRVRPRVDTLDQLLRACGESLASVDLIGSGVDRTVMRELLKLSPAERARLAVEEARLLEAVEVRQVEP